MSQNCAHQKKRRDQRTRIPTVFGGPMISTGLSIEEDADFVDETSATTEQRSPEVLKRRRLIEKFRLFSVRRNGDTLLFDLTANKVLA